MRASSGDGADAPAISYGEAVRAAAAAFTVSRALVVAVALVALHLGAGADGASLKHVTDLMLRGDGGWYVGTAQGGYAAGPFSTAVQRNWAFFPLLPVLLRAAARVTSEYALTGGVLSTVLFLAGLVLLHALAVALGFGSDVARRALVYTALWPTAMFFSVPTTEALFLVLSAGALLAGARGHFFAAGVAGALASAARPNGVVLVVPLAIWWWRQPARRWRDLLGLALVPLGLAAFMAYLGRLTGDPLAFSHIQVRLGRYPGFFLAPLWQYLRHPWPIASAWNFRLLNFLGALAALVAAAHFARRRRWALSAYALAGIALPLSTHSLQSIARFAMVLVPVPLALAELAPARARAAIVLALAVSLATMTGLFAVGYTFAVT